MFSKVRSSCLEQQYAVVLTAAERSEVWRHGLPAALRASRKLEHIWEHQLALCFFIV